MARTGERGRASRLNPLIDSDHTEDTLENIAAAIDSFASVVADITDLQALQGIALLLPALAAACRFEVEHPCLITPATRRAAYRQIMAGSPRRVGA